MTLHIISKHFTSSEEKALIQGNVLSEDACIFIQSGVYHCQSGFVSTLASVSPEVSLYVLEDHRLARGLNLPLPKGVQSATMKTFVTLTATHNKTITW